MKKFKLLFNKYNEWRLKRLIGNAAHYKSTSSDPKEKLFLYEQTINHMKHGFCLEVGSYLGSSSIIIAEAMKRTFKTKNVKLYCIDTWMNDAMSEGIKDTYEIFINNIKPWNDIIIPVRGKSQTVCIPNNILFDTIFIDADHSYDACRADVKRFSPLIREGGCLILDDHITFPGVTRVVGELLCSGHWYIKDTYINMVALYKDMKSFGKHRRKRYKNIVL